MSAPGERGSALVIALLVAFILSLLGMSFLMLAQAESRIAQNERLKEQAFYAAEAGVLAVKAWFDAPGTALVFPTPAEVDRSQRRILDPADPTGPTAGLATTPVYKATTDALFSRPYRGDSANLEDPFMGRSDFPDLRVDMDPDPPRATLVAEQALLRRLSDTLMGPGEPDQPYRTEISHISIYAPPYVTGAGTTPARFGIATVEVAARIYEGASAPGVDRGILAQQSVKVALNELPYSTPVFGPLHTCADLTVRNDLNVHWGTITVLGEVALPLTSYTPAGIPRQVPPGARPERLWNTTDADAIASYETACDGVAVDDPWFRIIGKNDIVGPAPTNASDQQPWSATSPSYVPPPCADRSNLIQRLNLGTVGCPKYDFEFWRNVAASGGPDVYYYVPDAGNDLLFRLNGVGPAQAFATITSGKDGLYFFDTIDGRAPHDDDGDGAFENLTREIQITGVWNARGFIYLNAQKLLLENVGPGGAETFQAPGEPRVVIDDAEVWVDLDYPTTLGWGVPIGPTADPAYNALGPAIPATADFSGILFTTGSIEARGLGRFYGSMIAQGLPGTPGQTERGIVLGSATEDVPDFYWNQAIVKGWPTPGSSLPRVAITRWFVSN